MTINRSVQTQEPGLCWSPKIYLYTKLQDTPAKCTLCGGVHAVNFSGCPENPANAPLLKAPVSRSSAKYPLSQKITQKNTNTNSSSTANTEPKAPSSNLAPALNSNNLQLPHITINNNQQNPSELIQALLTGINQVFANVILEINNANSNQQIQ
ncbi:hypothetical protein AVEN_88211-1 [Araneus ventricosus]|uniref:Uncharacterized protein n=1 Tax=Araneus ventricosus TaxID=182803 RepID=A0A4Y2HWM7_ARAVE|nr:hypothetical protein AVEN_88211-1 [Araneus ventricosus]